MAELTIAFRLPMPGAPRALFVTDYGLHGGRLMMGDRVVIEARSREALERGATGRWPGSPALLMVRAADPSDVRLLVGGEEALREDRLRAPTSRSTWIHASLALGGSGFGFVASWLYLERAAISGDPWAIKMALHMTAWHLLLTLTLFPLSVWGQRIGIRIVQGTSLVFFCIHLGIALANTSGTEHLGWWIALNNAASGLTFLAAAVQGFRAHADMDPLQSLRSVHHGPFRDPAHKLPGLRSE